MGLFDFFKSKKNKNNPRSPEERKSRTESILRELGVPVNMWLPLVESEEEVRVRLSVDVAKRILILAYLVWLAYDECDKDEIVSYFETNHLIDAVSSEEKQFLAKKSLEKNVKVILSWRSEAIRLLLWAIGKEDELELPLETCDIPTLFAKLPKQWDNPEEFIQTSVLRSTEEILDMVDLIYRLHWASRDAYLKGEEPPVGLHEDIIVERHYAINWLTFYADDWDDITTDT